jgi:hypothetical protein
MQAAILVILWLWAAFLVGLFLVFPVVVFRWMIGGRKHDRKK